MAAKQPTISLNKLAEFMSANPARQRQILYDCKYPTDFKGMYYREAAESIAQVIARNLEDLSPISSQRQILEQIQTDKVGTQRRIASNLDAIDGFEGMLDAIDLRGTTASLGDHTPEKLTLYGVTVSVRPDIILRKQGKTGPLIGAIKLHFPRQFSLSADAAGIVSAALQEWCSRVMPDEGKVAGELCFAIDVGSRTAFQGVKATAARFRQVEAACQNIASLWPGI